MNPFFEAVRRCGDEGSFLWATVLEGSAAGEKAVISGGKAAYFSDPEGLLKSREAELTAWGNEGSGVRRLNGSRVYIERIGQRNRLILCGCGHVSLPIIRLAKTLGFYVTAIDDREEFTVRAGEAGADKAEHADFSHALARIPGDQNSYFVVVTRGHQWDERCLLQICEKKHGYIGMMGSARRAKMVRQSLLEKGVDPGVIADIHTPIGLAIGAETPEEIAVSVMAEIIAVKNRKPEVSVSAELQSNLRGQAAEERGGMVLATIISRSGSAPRSVGSKMLIQADGSCIDTIGGGLLEAEVTARAGGMLNAARQGEERGEGSHFPASKLVLSPGTPLRGIEVLKRTLNADAASKEGEVCGGTLEILLELF